MMIPSFALPRPRDAGPLVFLGESTLKIGFATEVPVFDGPAVYPKRIDDCDSGLT
jgi:hypothetical protein